MNAPPRTPRTLRARPVEALLAILREEGVDRIFGNPGTTELPFTDALVDAPDLRYVLALQEASAVAMADGYARATGRTAFVSLHVAAGLANGLIGMINASRSRTPMVVTAGQQDRRHLVQDPMLSGDLVAMAAPVAKSAVEVHRAADLPIVLRRAFALAAQPPAGPVFVSIPMDLLAEQEPVDLPGRSTRTPQGPATGLADAAAVLAGARHPVIVAGDGVGRDGAVAELVQVAERLGATVYHQPMNDGIDFPGRHPLYAGMLPPRNAAVRELLRPHDALLIVGCRAFMPHHYSSGPAIPDGLTVVQLDADPQEIGRNFAVRLGLAGALTPSLAGLAEQLRAQPVADAADRTARLGAVHTARRDALDRDALARYGSAPLDPLAAVHALAAGLPPDTVVVEEAITAGLQLRTVLRQDRPRSYVHTVGGGLGWGIGAAVGTRLGAPRRPVAAVLGDGCAMFGVQGLWSAARYRVPAAFFVMNNSEYRTLKETLDAQQSRSTAARAYVGLDLDPGLGEGPTVGRLDWSHAARFFGIQAVRIDSAEQLREVAATVGELDAPLLVDVPVTSHSEEHRYPGADRSLFSRRGR
ncbi:thiamine pyrophosphate-binding protein [Streptacidiphilus sp. N1-10]|uniref:Thiamine pyrophosphate-binding protein n=1 Tax=Streptacidiphilus jeojiensis TaxID=3229225 RepID=A0ABV6XFP6_9ACTN